MHGGISEIQCLRDRIEELEGLLGAGKEDLDRLAVFGMPAICSVILGLLLKRVVVRREAAYVVIYGNRPEAEQPQIKGLDVYVWRVRQRLRLHQIELKTQFRVGWYLTPDDKAKINALIGAVRP
ncbi:hypothetical protein [Tardiphaga sp. 709]|uniref:hypothetical protein n=1 Tax=Tardiphaga sp. 709 TaxID=3076039 RepID=UPI0028F08FA7|nr:hypothetical protein [Tardiphaga sp. 709]WNV10116.1 hypothetical protein RSO67_02650 [Tardiphaga sp. 709]